MLKPKTKILKYNSKALTILYLYLPLLIALWIIVSSPGCHYSIFRILTSQSVRFGKINPCFPIFKVKIYEWISRTRVDLNHWVKQIKTYFKHTNFCFCSIIPNFTGVSTGLDETAIPCAVYFPPVLQANSCAHDKNNTRKKVESFKICILLQVDSLVKKHFCKTRVYNNNCKFYLKRPREKLLPSKGNHCKIVAYILQIEVSNKRDCNKRTINLIIFK